MIQDYKNYLETHGLTLDKYAKADYLARIVISNYKLPDIVDFNVKGKLDDNYGEHTSTIVRSTLSRDHVMGLLNMAQTALTESMGGNVELDLDELIEEFDF